MAHAEKLEVEKAKSGGGSTALSKAKEAVKITAEKKKGTYLEAAMAAMPAEDAGDDMAIDLVMAERLMQITLTKEYLQVDGFLMKALHDLPEERSAEECLSKYLPKQSILEIEKLQEELAELQQLLGFQEKKLTGTKAADAVETKKRIAALEKQIEKAGDGASKAAIQACEYEVARRKYEEGVGHRTARAEAGEQLARERSDRLE